MNKAFDSGLVWLRRDLRIDDNAALQLARSCGYRTAVSFKARRQIPYALPA